jgi:hypothetical protein
MTWQIKITEKDIFCYVIERGTLDKKKQKYIEGNYSDFKEVIDYCRAFRGPLPESELKELKKILKKKLLMCKRDF